MTTPEPRPKTRLRRALLQTTLGLAFGAALAEGAFHLRDHGAFPHLNTYVADEKLGARLRPGATEKVAFNGNPLTHVRINAGGFRGADHPAPGAGEILVFGDSQVFGLGVEEHETFTAALGRKMGSRTSLNLGVPTHGPIEYVDVLEETLSQRGGAGATVIYTVNFANDLFEASRPNRDRHVIWDGWAVRAETAPESIPWFPGREILFRESHAVFALRALLHRGSPVAVASEGTYRDLLGAAGARQEKSGALAAAVEEERRAQLALEAAADKAYPELMRSPEGKAYRRGHGNPEDIVVRSQQRRYAEGARPTDVTVQNLVQGAEIRARIERSLRKRAQREIERERGRAVLASLRERDALEARIEKLTAEAREAAASLSPLRAPLERAAALCKARGARLVVAALPLDVQVSEKEWAKYGAEPIDMSNVKILVEDLIVIATSLGAEAVDLTEPLRAAEPGAFLDGDLHLSPKGHRAVAEALERALAPRKQARSAR